MVSAGNHSAITGIKIRRKKEIRNFKEDEKKMEKKTRKEENDERDGKNGFERQKANSAPSGEGSINCRQMGKLTSPASLVSTSSARACLASFLPGGPLCVARSVC